MNKKEFLNYLWDAIMQHTDPNNLPKNDGDTFTLKWDVTIGKGPTSKMLKKNIQKWREKAIEEYMEIL